MPTYTGNPNTHPSSDFAQGMTGTCLCGTISVTIHDTELFTKPRGHLCHCANCRKVAGSFVSSNLVIEKEKVEVVDGGQGWSVFERVETEVGGKGKKGGMRKYEDRETGSGKLVERWFCGGCGNPIMSVAEALPAMVILKMGIYPRIPQPECESFAAHRHEWQGKHGDMTQFEIVRGGKKLGE